MTETNRTRKFHVVPLGVSIVGIALGVAPFFASVVPPMTDVSQHILVARILAAYGTPELHFFDHFTVHWSVAPGALFYGMFAALQKMTGPFWDARVYLSLWVCLTWLSVWYLAKTCGRPSPWIPALVSLPLAFCWYVYMGLLPFLMTIPLFAATVAAWLGIVRPLLRVAIVWIMLVLLFGFHVVGMAAAAAAIGIVAAVQVLTRKAAPSQLSWAAGALAPVPFLLAPYLLGDNAPTAQLDWTGPFESTIGVIRFTCSTLNDGATVLMCVWLLSLGGMVLLQWRGLLRSELSLFVAAVTLALLAILLPRGLGSLWPAGPRLLPFALVLVVSCLSWPDSRKALIAGAHLALLCGLSLLTLGQVRELDMGFRDFLAGANLVQPGHRLLPVLVDPAEGSRWVYPYWSLGSAYTVLRGGSNPYVFASPYVKTGASPLRFRQPEDRRYAFLYDESPSPDRYRGVSNFYDYVLVWGDDPELARVLADELAVISKRGRATLFARAELSAAVDDARDR